MVSSGETPLTAEGRERTLRMIGECEQVIALQRRDLAAMGLAAAEVKRALEPLESFLAMLREDVGISPTE